MAISIFGDFTSCDDCPAAKLCEEDMGDPCSVVVEKWLLQEAEE